MNPFWMMIYDIEHLCLRIKGGNKNLALKCHSYLDKDIINSYLLEFDLMYFSTFNGYIIQ